MILRTSVMSLSGGEAGVVSHLIRSSSGSTSRLWISALIVARPAELAGTVGSGGGTLSATRLGIASVRPKK